MNTENFQIKPMGERSILIEFEQEIDEKILEKVLILKKILEAYYIKSSVEVINTYNSLLIIYHSTIEDIYTEVLAIKTKIIPANIDKNFSGMLFHIPVCYEDKFALDIDFISEEKLLAKEEIIQLHTHPIYTIYFIGFLPGFLYLGGLDGKLQIARKNQPRLEVPKGAVGIGENQTGIYPQKSPGGWQIIGRSPVSFFNKNRNPPCEISAGDKLKFYAVSNKEYEEIKTADSAGKFQLKKENYGS